MNDRTTIQSLLVVSDHPRNAETPLPALDAAVTPSALVYVRCNFDIPVVDAAAWTLSLEGCCARPEVLTLDRLGAMSHREVHATVECAGNGRKLMNPVPSGTPWGLGAVSTVVFGGTPLRYVLELCGLDPAAVEIVCEGADRGTVDDGRAVRFVRSLPREQALHPDTLVAWTLNGEPLEPAHGYPLRLVVPGWYGVASVKWLTRLIAVTAPFTGHFQTERYVYLDHPEYEQRAPVTFMHVRSLITSPYEGAAIRVGEPGTIRGIAWSGFGAVRRVDVSTDEGAAWRPARLRPAASPWAAANWECDWSPQHAGEQVLMARAEDTAGGSSPWTPRGTGWATATTRCTG
ncbi:MAG TPA: sulfite oxidase [Longimicrobiales bacterium]|nr:sulfite oxidase [Longimicrobiales bacterium]